MSVYTKLVEIQSRVHCPKSLSVKNYSGAKQYDYRNLAGILERVKPILKELKCAIMIPCEPVVVGSGVGIVVEERDRSGTVVGSHVEGGAHVYQRATAILIDSETGEQVSVTACARENEWRKGMDASQVSGSAESFASKYAMEHLLALDSTDDADDLAAKERATAAPARPATPAQANPAKPNADDLAKPAPAVSKTVQRAKPNPRAAAAWKAFKALDTVKAMSDDEREKAWKNLIFTTTGATGAAKVSGDEAWDKIDNEISVMAAM